MPERTTADRRGDVKIPMAMRMRAWWGGQELSIKRKIKSVPVKEESNRQNLDRVALLQEIWGEHMHGPCSTDYALHLLKPLGLNPKLTVVELGGGLGGISRLMVQAFGIWVNCFEGDKTLADAGMRLSEMSGMQKKARITHFNPVTHFYRPNIADCVFTKEFFHQLENIERVLRASTILLKDKGQLLLTDFMLAEDAAKEDLKEWRPHLPYTPNLWKSNRFERTLGDLNMDVRINEDLSARFCELVVQAWQGLNSSSRLSEFNSETCDMIVREVERWAATTKLIEAGVVQVRRIHSIKKSAFDPRELRGSDWA